MTFKQRLGRWLIPRLPISRFGFEILRPELAAIRVRWAWKLFPTRWTQLKKIRQLSDININVASGGNILPGMVHLDLFGGSEEVIRWDCRRSLPFADESAKGIRTEHFLEHIDFKNDLSAFLTECFRVLQPGGVLRVIVPDCEAFLCAYASNDPAAFEKLGWKQPFPDDLPTKMDVINHMFHQHHEHRFGYDFESLAHRLRTVGFEPVKKMAFAESLLPELAQDLPHHQLYSLYVDASKPV